MVLRVGVGVRVQGTDIPVTRHQKKIQKQTENGLALGDYKRVAIS